MDYDRYDAFLHHIFKQTQGDAWFRPNEEHLTAGVALRIADNPPQYRVFPYENISLEPFETAVSALNPLVAVKVRSAAVHAALADIPSNQTSLYVDADTRIQILETMMHLPHADKEQRAAFIRDERVLVVWSESLDTIIPTCQDFEDRLIKLLWRSRPNPVSSASIGLNSYTTSAPSSVSGHSFLNARNSQLGQDRLLSEKQPFVDTPATEKGAADTDPTARNTKIKRKWYGKKYTVFEDNGPERRPAMLYAPIYNGLAAGLALVFIGNGVKNLLQEWALDGSFIRFSLAATLPFLYCVSLFFCLQIIQNVTMAIGPVAHYHKNSKYYSAVRPRPNDQLDNDLPHITIQMPVYKESLETVLLPSIESLKKAMQTYARQGGTSTIFINDDGLRLLSAPDRDARLAFYANHGIGWVARPPHDNEKGGFKRAGRFKKASNMNYALALSLKMEKILDDLITEASPTQRPTLGNVTPHGTYGLQYTAKNLGPNGSIMNLATASPNADSASSTSHSSAFPNFGGNDLEERALQLAIEETFNESDGNFRPWAANGRACRLGEIILIVDSDTVVPEDCLRDAAREMRECETVGIIQHDSDVMQVAHHYFENGIAYFTRRVNRCISMSCANGEVAPFMGHNAFLRWSAVQDAAFIDPADGKQKIWSETNVSEDFDMALRLQLKGYIIRWATYSNGGFKEGVSLSVDDELNRWQKYAYGCSELLFNPFSQWWRKGPITHQIHRFLWSKAPLHYKISMMAYMFSYYGIAASITIGIINYALLGFQFPVDGFYMHSFEIWLATTVVFFGSGNVGYTLLEYRLGHRQLILAFLENLKWIPFFFFFFGGLSIPVSQAILAHLFSYNITWSATIKEVQRSNFFKEVPKIIKRFWFPLLVSIVIIAGMIIVSTPLVPVEWRIDGSAWAVIFPLSAVTGCHILFPIVLNPWLMIFSY